MVQDGHAWWQHVGDSRFYLLRFGDGQPREWLRRAITDVISRCKTMRGFNVMHPIGWDAFGLPAENAAIQRGIHPEKWTRQNIAGMKRQLQRLGFSYPWSREIATCDPEYYRWNQWFFLRMLERGIAYRAKAPVNWAITAPNVTGYDMGAPADTSGTLINFLNGQALAVTEEGIPVAAIEEETGSGEGEGSTEAAATLTARACDRMRSASRTRSSAPRRLESSTPAMARRSAQAGSCLTGALVVWQYSKSGVAGAWAAQCCSPCWNTLRAPGSGR